MASGRTRQPGDPGAEGSPAASLPTLYLIILTETHAGRFKAVMMQLLPRLPVAPDEPSPA